MPLYTISPKNQLNTFVKPSALLGVAVNPNVYLVDTFGKALEKTSDEI